MLILVSAPYLEHSSTTYSLAQFLANVTMVPKLFGFSEMSGVFWTLFIEIVFYGCCTALFQFNFLDKPIVIAAIALGLNLSTPLAILLNKYFQLGIPVQFLLFHLSFLFAGNLLRLAFAEKAQAAMYAAALFALLNVLTVPVSSGIWFSVPEAVDKGFVMFNPESVVCAYILAACVFMVALHYKSAASRFMVRMGEASYSLYLLHMFCFVLVKQFVSPETTVGFFVYFVASIALAIVVARLSFRYIEFSGIEIGRKITRSLGYA